MLFPIIIHNSYFYVFEGDWGIFEMNSKFEEKSFAAKIPMKNLNFCSTKPKKR